MPIFFLYFLSSPYKKGLSSPLRIEYSVIEDGLEWVERKECLISDWKWKALSFFDRGSAMHARFLEKKKKKNFPGGDKRKWTNACIPSPPVRGFTSRRFLKPVFPIFFLAWFPNEKKKGVQRENELYWGFAWTTKGCLLIIFSIRHDRENLWMWLTPRIASIQLLVDLVIILGSKLK